MDKFLVEMPIQITVNVTVDAENAEDAIDRAMEELNAQYEDDLLIVNTDDASVYSEIGNLIWPKVVNGKRVTT